MVRAIELLFTLLQLGPLFVLSIGSNSLSSQLAPTSRQTQTEEPECTTLSS
jgi:hypothetical protein